jgi:hypothetical protein
MAHFIPLTESATAEKLAKIFVREIWRLHGLPSDIVSNRDSQFTSNFWQGVLTRLGIRPRMNTSFRPQTDGQTEKINQSVELYVRTFCNYEQDDWTDLLPMAEYTYNNSITQGTGLSPFYSNYEFHPQTNWPTAEEAKNPASDAYVHYCNVRGRGSLSHYLVYSESPSRWCSLAIILLIYLHHNLLFVSNRSIQNTYRLVILAVLTLLSLSCSLKRFAFVYHVNLSKTRYTVTPEFHHHVRNRENGHTWFDGTPENRV